jgi:hypothetical protein
MRRNYDLFRDNISFFIILLLQSVCIDCLGSILRIDIGTDALIASPELDVGSLLVHLNNRNRNR